MGGGDAWCGDMHLVLWPQSPNEFYFHFYTVTLISDLKIEIYRLWLQNLLILGSEQSYAARMGEGKHAANE